MTVLSTFLGLVHAPRKNEKVKEQVVNNLDARNEMRLAKIDSYMSADDNEGIADLALYF